MYVFQPTLQHHDKELKVFLNFKTKCAKQNWGLKEAKVHKRQTYDLKLCPELKYTFDQELTFSSQSAYFRPTIATFAALGTPLPKNIAILLLLGYSQKFALIVGFYVYSSGAMNRFWAFGGIR